AIFLSSTCVVNQPAQAAGLKDLNQCADYAKPSVERLSQSGIVNGNENGYFYPKQVITRAQMITLIVKSLGLDENISPENTDTFKDVPQNHWANKYVEIAYQSGITSGIAPDQFGVNQTCTREQMTTLFVNTFKLLDDKLTEIPSQLIDLNRFTDEAQISDWARDPLAFAVYMGLISGTSASTMGPKMGAEREQVAVLTDRFIDKKDNIVMDLQAQRILGKTIQEQFNGQGISNTGEIEIKVALQQTDSDLPSEVSFKAHLTNDMVWPAAFHQTVGTEITGLPSNDYSQLNVEQYLVDGILYQKLPDENNHASWVRTSPTDMPDISKLMQNVKDAQTSQLLLPDEIHKSGQVKLEDAVVNETNGHKITYTGQLTDISGLFNQILPASLPATLDSSQVQYLLDTVQQSVKSISFSEVFFVGADNLIYGNQLNININCKDETDVEDIPVKSIIITSRMDNYKYHDISIVLPPEAKVAP
ncbi:MAG: S-layer homology domain-containing protein, partial [Syntrophomonas sp.]